MLRTAAHFKMDNVLLSALMGLEAFALVVGDRNWFICFAFATTTNKVQQKHNGNKVREIQTSIGVFFSF